MKLNNNKYINNMKVWADENSDRGTWRVFNYGSINLTITN